MDFFSLVLSKRTSGSSGGIEYSSIVYNDDGTVTLTEKDGTAHTMTCTYENGKLISMTYDGNEIDLTYADDLLLSVSGMSVDVNNVPTKCIEPLDHTVTFKVDGEIYEIASVKDGNSVNPPSTIPTSSRGTFSDWIRNGEVVTLPFIPTEDAELSAYFAQLISDELYLWYSISKIDCPYCIVYKDNTSMAVMFGKQYSASGTSVGFQDVKAIFYSLGFDTTAYTASGLIDKIKSIPSYTIEDRDRASTPGSYYNYRFYKSGNIVGSSLSFTDLDVVRSD